MVSGEARGVRAGVVRGLLAAASPVYSMIVRARNAKFDRGVGVRRLPRAVVSVGNITTGGTGKTPVVRWLCERLREVGERPAVLMRGYRAKPGERGDEQAMLAEMLGADGIVHAQADRYAGGMAVLRERPETSFLVMDDGFQHRRLGRDFDLVLVDASEPFGYGRVLPRGLLREPLSGLRRADAILITRADQGDVGEIERTVRRFNAAAPVFACAHALVGLRAGEARMPMEALAGRRIFAFAGIGNPQGFEKQLQALGGEMVGRWWLADHWNYSHRDMVSINGEARRAGAEVVVTSEKDWVKVARVVDERTSLPVWRVELAVRFLGDDERKLFELIRARLKSGQR